MRTKYPMKIHNHYKINPLKLLRNSNLSEKGNLGNFKHHNQRSTVFQGFKGLEKKAVILFLVLQGPVKTLLTIEPSMTVCML